MGANPVSGATPHLINFLEIFRWVAESSMKGAAIINTVARSRCWSTLLNLSHRTFCRASATFPYCSSHAACCRRHVSKTQSSSNS